MPLRFGSVISEHQSVRETVGVFDVTHLGRFSLTGKGAHQAISALLCNDIDRIEPGKCQYTMMLNEDGGVIDDIIVWWLGDDEFWVMPNAVNQARVMESFARHAQTKVADLQGSTVFLAVQGPSAQETLDRVFGRHPGRFRNLSLSWKDGTTMAAAGTGYTGEPGAELCMPSGVAGQVLSALLDAGAQPCGLGARDTLRLEAGFPLWGSDLNESFTPLEAGLNFAVSFDHEFTGRSALLKQREQGLERAMAGIVLNERGVPRSGCSVTAANGATGIVTSGNMSPILGQGIALAYMAPPQPTGTPVEVEIRGRQFSGTTARPPFHVSG